MSLFSAIMVPTIGIFDFERLLRLDNHCESGYYYGSCAMTLLTNLEVERRGMNTKARLTINHPASFHSTPFSGIYLFFRTDFGCVTDRTGIRTEYFSEKSRAVHERGGAI